MDEIKEFFSNIFETEYWPARWHCGYWSDFHGWLYILSDLSIWAAYFTIPVIIIKFVSKKAAYVSMELIFGLRHLFWLVALPIYWMLLFFGTRYTALLRW